MTFLSWLRLTQIYQAFENLIPGTTYDHHHHYYYYSNTSSADFIYASADLRLKEKHKTLVPNLNGLKKKNMLVSSLCSLFFINNLQRPRINMSFEGGAGFTRLYSPYLHIRVPLKRFQPLFQEVKKVSSCFVQFWFATIAVMARNTSYKY